MEYNIYFGEGFGLPSEKDEERVILPRNKSVAEPEFYRPRLGIPEGFISWDDNKDDIMRIISLFISKGYWHTRPKDINPELRKHIEAFRNRLDCYEIIVQDKVFSREELYFRCLSEGPAFTSFIKKSREMSLQAKISISDVNLDWDYVHEEYTGYDSILNEAHLIYWDDSEEVVDWPYSLIEPKAIDEDKLEGMVRRLFRLAKIDNFEGHDIINIISQVANKKTSLNTEDGATALLKDAWTPTEGGEWYATRKVVPTIPGKTRDTGVGDIETLCKVKLIHKHARAVSELVPYSANCPFQILNRRLNRIRGKSNFLHVDFRKFGLTFNRGVPNTVLKVLNKEHLQIKEFYLNADRIIKTKRGGVLGWFDPLVALGVIAILLNTKCENGWKDMDFLVFNDDVEIGFDEHSEYEIERRRLIILRDLEQFDFIISYRKVFASRGSIFLEEYCGDFNGLNMNKTQALVKQYGKSLSTPYGWEAKMYYAEACRHVESSALRDICQGSIDPLFPEEYDKPVELGGWTHFYKRGLNDALSEATHEDLKFFLKMTKYKEPHLMPKMKVVTLEGLWRRKQERIADACTMSITKYQDRIQLDVPPKFSEDRLEALRIQAGEPEQAPSDYYSTSEEDEYYGERGKAPPLPTRPA